jgi:serine protease AprX
MYLRLLCAFCLLTHLGFTQKPMKYWVEFTDKNNSPYSLSEPGMFLSARALDRRSKAGIALDETDLPVSPAYLNVLKSKGLQLHGVSRWLNAAVVIADTSAVKTIRQLPFVKQVQYLGPHLKFRNPANRLPKKRSVFTDYPKPGGTANPLGYATLQNSLLNLPPLYAAGHRGKGIWIAVMDGGFTNADTIPLFDSVALQGRLHPGWDFVERDAGVFEAAAHGTSVLSVMAANLPGFYVGTAPEATYFLIKTEDTGGEFPIEEANWIAGAEWADSLGIDIINASLGYTSFNDTTLSHRYRDLDGRTALGSKGAAIAATKGMIVCNANGNEGDGPWHYLGVPADADGVIGVGAVGNNGERAAFSSFGPTADGRIKPDLVAPGDDVVVAGNAGTELGISGGTSIASPMLAGGLAALWSIFPEKPAREILNAVFQSADQYQAPDNARGWGMPDFTHAWLTLGGYTTGQTISSFDRNHGKASLLISHDFLDPNGKLELCHLTGTPVQNLHYHMSQKAISTLSIQGLEQQQPGAYMVRFTSDTHTGQFFIVLHP